MMSKFEIIWQAPEFEYRRKDVSWYWLSVILAIIILSFAIWQKNFLFGIFIVLAEILILVWGNRSPDKIEFKITNEGLDIGGKKFYPYRSMDSFSLSEGGGTEWQKLVIHFKKNLRPALKINILPSQVGTIAKNLQAVLKQIEYQPSLVDILEEFLRF